MVHPFFLSRPLESLSFPLSLILLLSFKVWDFPGSLDGKESACNAGDPGSVPVEKGMATHSRNLVWRIPWTEATVHGVANSQI